MASGSARAFVDWLDAEAESFSNATTREHYLNYAGLKDSLRLTPIFRKHARLFQRDTVERAVSLNSRDARLGHLREFVIDGYLEQAAKTLTEEIDERETSDVVRVGRRDVPYRSVSQMIINEGDAAKRHALDDLRAEVTSTQNDRRERRWDLLYKQTRDLGYQDYVDLCDKTGGLHLEDLRDMLEGFLWGTDQAYREQLSKQLGRIDVNPAAAERSDLSRLFRSPEFDASFPRERMVAALDETLRGLGIDVDNQPNVHLDTDERPKKSPRAFCAPADIPGEIYLVISPHGGHDDYQAFFHEAGHTQHFAHVPRDLPYAFRGLGDNSVTEGFAFVLEAPLRNEAWLKRMLGMKAGQARSYIAAVAFHKLYMLRRYGAKLLYELDLHKSDNVRGWSKRYADLLTAKLGARHKPSDYLSDLDDGFYAARYLRAWIFDAQLRAWFERRWGKEWFAVPAAGKKLRALWAYGQRYSAEELLAQLGYKRLDISHLQRELGV
jgi:hypothetical protein